MTDGERDGASCRRNSGCLDEAVTDSFILVTEASEDADSNESFKTVGSRFFGTTPESPVSAIGKSWTLES